MQTRSFFVSVFSRLNVNERALVFTKHNAFERTGLMKVEDSDRHALIAAERKSRGVQNLEFLLNGFVEGQRLIHFCVGILLRISGKYAVNLSGFQNHIGSDFRTSQSCSSIRCEERITGAGSKNHNAAFLQMAQCFAANVRLGNLVDIQGALDTGFNTGVSQCS